MIGIVHLISSILALVFGTVVILGKKGTRTHKKWGYAYVVSMIGVNLSAFLIYKLFGGFGIFHVAALVSSLTLVGGMIPVLRKKNRKKSIFAHFAFMYWSVMGLYAAFASELLTRIPETPFFGMVGIATGIIMTIAYVFFYRNKKIWYEQFIR